MMALFNSQQNALGLDVDRTLAFLANMDPRRKREDTKFCRCAGCRVLVFAADRDPFDPLTDWEEVAVALQKAPTALEFVPEELFTVSPTALFSPSLR